MGISHNDDPAPRGSRGAWLLLLTLTWVLVAAGASFVRGGRTGRRPPGEPPVWKQLVWVALFVCWPSALFVIASVATSSAGGH